MDPYVIQVENNTIVGKFIYLFIYFFNYLYFYIVYIENFSISEPTLSEKDKRIVYPYECVIDVFISINGIFKFDKKYTNNDEIFVKTLPGLKILMNDIFEN